MRKLFARLKPIPLFLVVWMILNEAFSWSQFLLGLVFSMIALSFTNTVLLRNDYSSVYQIRPTVLFRYVTTVLGQIYHSSFMAIPRILSGRGAVAIDTYESSLENDLPLAMLATAVTLTPGTVTVSLSDQTLQILHFSELCLKNGPKAGDWQPIKTESILDGKRS